MENLIECNPKIMLGKPVIKGTRITVESILEMLAAGESFESILSQYPHLSREKVASAVRFALHAVQHDFPLRTENQSLLEAVNEAYKEPDTIVETAQIRMLQKKSFEVLDEWK